MEDSSPEDPGGVGKLDCAIGILGVGLWAALLILLMAFFAASSSCLVHGRLSAALSSSATASNSLV